MGAGEGIETPGGGGGTFLRAAAKAGLLLEGVPEEGRGEGTYPAGAGARKVGVEAEEGGRAGVDATGGGDTAEEIGAARAAGAGAGASASSKRGHSCERMDVAWYAGQGKLLR